MKRAPALNSSPISRILVPIDAVQTKLSDLRPILQMACRLQASVMLLHCYIAPPSFDFAAGDGSLNELSLHRWRVRSRLYQLTGEARKLYPKCSCRSISGSPATQILRQSQKLLADLIAIPLPLDLIRWCWLPEELVDELIRKANCPVLCVPASQTFLTEASPSFLAPKGQAKPTF
jgi:Universal stress protein family